MERTNAEKKLEAKLRPAILAPSLLYTVDFWERATNLQRIFPVIYVPESIKQMKNIEFIKFYGGYLSRDKIVSVEEVVKRCQEYFRSFSWEEYSEKMPEQFMVGFSNLRRGLEESYIAKLIQNALLDEFVFVTTQSSILFRMKKVFRRFEEFDAIPLLNLEKRAPKKWKKAVRGIKKAVSIINWIGSIGAYTMVLGPMIGSLVGPTVKGIRLLLVDPAPNGLTLFQ